VAYHGNDEDDEDEKDTDLLDDLPDADNDFELDEAFIVTVDSAIDDTDVSADNMNWKRGSNVEMIYDSAESCPPVENTTVRVKVFQFYENKWFLKKQ
ncbi:hypothetical protein BGZ65_005290, partial [Modicella reniformis]